MQKINYNKVVDTIINDETNIIKKATQYISPKLIIRAVRRTSKTYKPRKGENVQISLTIGRPNYAEREFIKLCTKAKEKFPVRNIQFKFFGSKKNKLKKK